MGVPGSSQPNGKGADSVKVAFKFYQLIQNIKRRRDDSTQFSVADKAYCKVLFQQPQQNPLSSIGKTRTSLRKSSLSSLSAFFSTTGVKGKSSPPPPPPSPTVDTGDLEAEVCGVCDDPARGDVSIDFFVGGEEYFSAVADGLENAKQSILIAGWSISPMMYLKRAARPGSTPTSQPLPQQYRLDLLLQSKAQMGVNIFIILWRDKVNLGSAMAKEYLRDLHPNIRVIRHGPSIDKAFWSHHEKYVIVDNEIAFVGGLDFYFGRWDTWTHPLVDLKQPQTWQGCDYYNPSASSKDTIPQNHKSPMKDRLDRTVVPRMPWQDVAVRVNGVVVCDLSAHFIDRWYQYLHADRKDTIYYALLPQGFWADYSYPDAFELDYTVCLQLDPHDAKKRVFIKNKESSKYMGGPAMEEDDDCCVVNFWRPSASASNDNEGLLTVPESKDFSMSDGKLDNYNNRKQSRWSLGALTKDRQKHIKKDTAKNSSKQDIERQRTYSFYFQGYAESTNEEEKRTSENSMVGSLLGIPEEEKSTMEEKENDFFLCDETLLECSLSLNPGDWDDPSGSVKIQLLLSCGRWSGFSKTVVSIHDAYINSIVNATKSIYIENQYFISSVDTSSWQTDRNDTSTLPELGSRRPRSVDSNRVKNLVAAALAMRLAVAIRKKERFKVMVVLPLFPEEGHEGPVPRAVMHFQYHTINRGENCLLAELRWLLADIYPDSGDLDFGKPPLLNYVSFFSLRQSETSPQGELLTHQIYIHSKVMIVDDTVCIIGSANINDRSMLGHRDSEVNLRISDRRLDFQNQIRHFRCRLLAHHLGYPVSDPLVSDPWSHTNWSNIHDIAENNSAIFAAVFPAFPNSNLTSEEDIRKAQKKQNSRSFRDQSLRRIVGFMVMYPLQYLEKENLRSQPGQVTSFLPSQLQSVFQ